MAIVGMISCGRDLAVARDRLGLTAPDLATWLRLGDWIEPARNRRGGDRIAEMEAGNRQITGPIAVAVESFLLGYKPEHVL